MRRRRVLPRRPLPVDVAPQRVPSPDALWARSGGDGTAYLALLHAYGYYSWPLYNREPEEAR